MGRKIIRNRAHPGERIREEYIKPLNLTIKRLATNHMPDIC